MSQNELKDIHSTDVDGVLEQWHVERTQAFLLGLGRWAILDGRHRVD